jgi:PAS domain S-box-containing protein
MTVPVPEREAERLAALRSYDVLDTPPEATFDRITRVAARLFGVPFALVTLVDEERQWMKSCYGIDLRETPREISFCAHTILSNEVLVVPDATQDARFAQNPLVTGDLHIRFYAGAPLQDQEGHLLGALCLIDTVPRQFEAPERETLQALADTVVNELALRRAARRLRDEQQERVQVETALRGSEERCRELIEVANDLIYRTDAAGRFTFFNPIALRLTGFSSAELLQKHYLDLVHPDYYDNVRRFYGRQFVRRIRDTYLEYPMVAKDGTTIWFGQQVHLLVENGDVKGFQAVARDITKRKEAEDRLRLMESVVVNANDAVLITEAEPINEPGPRIIYVNEAFSRMTGYSLEEVVGKTPRILQGPDTDRQPRDKIRQALSKWQPVNVELLNYRKDGTPFWVELSIVPVADESGWFTHWVSVQRETTERKAAEQALLDSQTRKIAVLETSLDCIITLDHEGRVQEWNSAAQSTFGYTLEEVRGRDIAQVIGVPRWRESLCNGLRKFLENGEWWVLGQRLEVKAKRSDGTEIDIEASLQHIPVTGPPQFTLYIRDITQRKQSEAALMAAKEEAERQRESAEQANEAKSEFLSRMSHELRTPLNAILGFGQLLELSSLPQEDDESVTQIMKAGRHLLGLINEVLEISRIESGQLTVSKEPVSVDELCQEVLTLMTPQASKAGVTLHPYQAATPGWFILADQQRIKQALINLLSNAIKYNHQGGDVRLKVEAVEAAVENETPKLRIAISDTGWGIAAEDMERLWTPFDRLGAERTGVEGTGIGLALSKRLIEVMDGRLSVESVVGQGSTFSIELPRVPSPLEAMPESDDAASSNNDFSGQAQHKVLYIEDNFSNLQLIQRIMETRPDVSLLTAMQGPLGLELAIKHRPQLILLDLHLPEMPGQEVLQRLQEQPETRDIPVVVVSADATSQQVQRLLDAGAKYYLTKPFNMRELLRILDETFATAL